MVWPEPLGVFEAGGAVAIPEVDRPRYWPQESSVLSTKSETGLLPLGVVVPMLECPSADIVLWIVHSEFYGNVLLP